MLETEEASLEIFAPVPVSTSTLETVGGGGISAGVIKLFQTEKRSRPCFDIYCSLSQGEGL